VLQIEHTFDEQVFESQEVLMLVHHTGRLTQQGRLLRTFLGLLAAITAFALVPQAAADGPEPPRDVVAYTFAPGDTLWAVAQRITPEGGDPWGTVDLITEINQLDSSSVRAGQQLSLPVLTP